MGHYLKLHPRPHYYTPSNWYQLHTFNGGVSAGKRLTRAYKQKRVDLKIIYRVHTQSKYHVVDGVLRRQPSTLPIWQQQYGTSRADARRARQRVKGLANECRSNAHRSCGAIA